MEHDLDEPQGEAMERYPSSLTLVRHAESKYNALKHIFTQWEAFRAFNSVFKKEYYVDAKNQTVRPDFDEVVLEQRWPSPELRQLALVLYKQIRVLMNGVSDFDTPITDEGARQARETGKRIAEHAPKPDLIYVSPYLRTHQTLDLILDHAPSDWKGVQQWENESIREQEHGMQTVFNDWRLAFVFDPMEAMQYNKQGAYSYRYRGGESKFDVRSRSSRFIGRLRRKHEGENILAVTHHLTRSEERRVGERV